MRLDFFGFVHSELEAMLCGNPPNGPYRFVWGWGNFQILRVFFFLDCDLSLLFYGNVLVNLYIIYK